MALSSRVRAEWIVARLDGAAEPPPGASPEERDALAREAEACGALWEGLAAAGGTIADEVVGEHVAAMFERRLAAERVKGTAPGRALRRAPLAWAAAVAAVLVALWLVQVQRPGRRPRVAGDTPSAARRLEEVLAPPPPGATPAHDIEGLADVLLRERNPNVRLAALEVLTERHGREGLEGRIGAALAGESDPMVRVAMIRLIGDLGLAGDAPALRALLGTGTLDPIARREADRALAELGS